MRLPALSPSGESIIARIETVKQPAQRSRVLVVDDNMDAADILVMMLQMFHEVQTKDVSLIAIAGYGQDSDRQRSQAAGGEHHLVKPVDPQKLQDLLATRARRPRSRT